MRQTTSETRNRTGLSLPQLISLAAVVLGALLFALTLSHLDFDETIGYATRLGLAFPLLLVPATVWHLLRTWGWWIAFPERSRPAFTRLFRVRLAADAISFFTVRGLTGEPLKVLLLIDRTPANVSTAAIASERLAVAIGSVIVAGLVSHYAVRQLSMPVVWDTTFTTLSVAAVVSVGLLALLVRRRTGDYLGRLVHGVQRLTGRDIQASRVVRFILDVEAVMLELARGDRRRLVFLTWMPIACYLINAFEVWLVFWLIGEPIGITESLAIETFVRLASVAGAMVPASLGTLEASHAAVVTALGLSGGGALVLARRIRSLLWAALGLALYPKIGKLAASSVAS